VTLDRRRVAVGEKIELTATAHDAKGAPIPDVKLSAPPIAAHGQPPRFERFQHDPLLGHQVAPVGALLGAFRGRRERRISC
jgi:hypothetical protein